MATFKMTDAGAFVMTCDGRFVMCNDESEGTLCCMTCPGGAGDEGHYQVYIPCGAINLNLAGVTTSPAPNDICVPCSNFNDDWEIDGGCIGTGGGYAQWGPTNFGNQLTECFLEMIPRVIVAVCCDEGNDEIVLYVAVDINGVFVAHVELDRQPYEDGACHFFDFLEWMENDGEIDCGEGDLNPECGLLEPFCRGAVNPENQACVFAGSTVTLSLP